MDELAKQMEEARQHVEPHWDAAKVESSLLQFHGRVRRRRATRTALVVAAPVLIVALLLGGGWVLGFLSSQGTRSIASTTIPPMQGRQISGPGSSIHFADGSMATTLGGDSHLVAAEVSSSSIRVRLDGGAARFEVSPRPERLFQVDTGDVSVLVLGTVFSVRRDGDRVIVDVERGRVRVAWPDGAQVIAAGHREVFERAARSDEETALAARGDDPQEPQRAERPTRTQRRPEPSESWRALAEQGRYDEAYQALQRAGGLESAQSMGEALVASDVARLSGHPAQAVAVLERAIARHPGDPQASVAHYTLGRVLLNQVGRHGAAARSFANARRLAPGGALAEDALAREVEAWSRAGVAQMARQRASEYVERYPQGRRRNEVRRFGGLDE
jgi:transmembrane sensor